MISTEIYLKKAYALTTQILVVFKLGNFIAHLLLRTPQQKM